MQPLEKIAEESLQNRRSALERIGRERAVNVTSGSASPKQDRNGAPHLAWHEHLREPERIELHEIDGALERIKKGSYGHCEGCGRVIGRQRLRASPEARRCVSCDDAVTSL